MFTSPSPAAAAPPATPGTDLSNLGQANGLDGSAIEGIVADPVRGSHDIYVVTQKGVYYMANTTATNPIWVNISGTGTNSILAQMHSVFGNATQTQAEAQTLTSIVADWRYTIPNNPTVPNRHNPSRALCRRQRRRLSLHG